MRKQWLCGKTPYMSVRRVWSKLGGAPSSTKAVAFALALAASAGFVACKASGEDTESSVQEFTEFYGDRPSMRTYMK